MSGQNKPLILVDGSSYLYRAFHALPALANSKGFPTGAVYGMVNMLKKLIADYHPDYMAVIFDAKGKTFRDELYPAYKATRQEMPSELTQQIDPIHRIIRAMGLPLIMVEGVEADDVIGTLTAQAGQKNMISLISTGDKDLAQLVDEKVTLINTMSNTLLTPLSVKEKFGVPPERIIDYLTLVGDSTDNIPGVPQVGPKTAAKWLQEYGSLENIIAHAEQISGKVGENLRASLKELPLTKLLVTIKADVKLPIKITDLAIQPSDQEALIELYREMEFKTWLSELLSSSTESLENVEYEIINSAGLLKIWIAKLKASELFAFTLETAKREEMQAPLTGISFAIAKGKAAYIPLGHDYPNVSPQLSKELVLTELKPLFLDPARKKIGWNTKYDRSILAEDHIDWQGSTFDTMMESYVLDSISSSHDIHSLALKYLGIRTSPLTDIIGKGSKQIPFYQVDIKKAGAYATENADALFRLHQNLWPRITKEQGLRYIFEQIEMPLVPVLARMEKKGVLIDAKQLEKQGQELQARLLQLEQEIYQLVGKPFNINSPKQLQEILFDYLKLPIINKTPTGQPSTADPVLQELALDFAVARAIIEYRSLSKLISTYTSRLIEQINPTTKRIHTSYNQTGTATGRLSSSEPNLQNIPIRTVEGRRIRQAFVAAKGCKIISADYSQIELRLMAHISEDPNLLHAFLNDLDIHQATAAEVSGIPIDQVTQTMRRDAKAINFGLIYGMSAFGLTRQLGIDKRSAQDYIERYFKRYPNVEVYMDRTRKMAKEKGYVETLWGRRLYLPDIKASNLIRQKAAERTAINAPLQGSAADIIKLAMIRIDNWIQEEKPPVSMIMQVHDELVFEAKEESLAEIMEKIRHFMISVVKLRVPLVVSIGHGDNWDQASTH